MLKPKRPSEENGATSGPAVSKPHFRQTSKLHFRNEDEFSSWIDAQLDTLEARFADFTTKDSLRGYFSR